MRKKKFRKITEKNIASIYGKILSAIRYKGSIYPSNIWVMNPVNSSIAGNVNGCVLTNLDDTTPTIMINFTGVVKHVPLWCSSLYSPYQHRFRITPGDRIHMTGSTIIIKHGSIKLTLQSLRHVQGEVK